MISMLSVTEILKYPNVYVQNVSIYGTPSILDDQSQVVILNDTAYIQNHYISCYYINLNHSIHRNEHMKRELANPQLPLFIRNCQRFPGIVVESGNQHIKRGVLGCFKSHHGVWQTSQTLWTLVLEDDVKFTNINRCKYNNFDLRYDFVRLDGSRCYYSHILVMQTSKFKFEIDWDQLKLPIDHILDHTTFKYKCDIQCADRIRIKSDIEELNSQ